MSRKTRRYQPNNGKLLTYGKHSNSVDYSSLPQLLLWWKYWNEVFENKAFVACQQNWVVINDYLIWYSNTPCKFSIKSHSLEQMVQMCSISWNENFVKIALMRQHEAYLKSLHILIIWEVNALWIDESILKWKKKKEKKGSYTLILLKTIQGLEIKKFKIWVKPLWHGNENTDWKFYDKPLKIPCKIYISKIIWSFPLTMMWTISILVSF